MSAFVAKVKERGIAHEPAAPALEMRDVSVAYVAGAQGLVGPAGNGMTADGYALKDVSFTVEVGQRIAVVGPNGAGKSTLFKLVAGMLKPTRGMVNVYGRVADKHICIAYVPQRSQIDWSFPVTVEDVVMMGRVGQIGLFRWPGRRDWEMVRASLARVNAGHLAHKQIGELSGGQQQRVFIARALAQEADLLLLDEPFAGLDVPSHEAIFEILDMLHRDGVTVLVATHDLNMAAERFDQVMLLNRRIVALGPAGVALTPDNLLQAYGGHLHRVADEGQVVLVADSCCEEERG
ncbi:MAG: metal ABC transporter ATP-binding protein [Chloroflexi bacterium]|nr:metal ABC transporter ATP-binding protein [Chloroflexota bacterium]MCI0578505.1 metal ABC transporter ATP-binding protein [Chloroflexota bacterium]MCI0648478.1 metal ABC transporter ATP-binding protein [Chloroflexota bacterium]MCI0726002.1 metal ABC transporter ATP-binding protein [Chloroflexota bacterium]